MPLIPCGTRGVSPGLEACLLSEAEALEGTTCNYLTVLNIFIDVEPNAAPVSSQQGEPGELSTVY